MNSSCNCNIFAIRRRPKLTLYYLIYLLNNQSTQVKITTREDENRWYATIPQGFKWMTGTIKLIRILLLFVIQHGGDDISCKRRIVAFTLSPAREVRSHNVYTKNSLLQMRKLYVNGMQIHPNILKCLFM